MKIWGHESEIDEIKTSRTRRTPLAKPGKNLYSFLF
ncbi:hypothetical protein HRM2_35940 [Desulforapulum autotrophicum HRM2]|uniref:Uncharacterized protein n=1 Tax=Desulforapulum autotrophicum (strain ATCC 43914 / DSM 3382 / VKM B-1955 / HRM2) TaxID=177437 RepID=C0Q9U1_DESAH|nr:hypothetical protein HRM2_35940 [Desulforapulum autotrophicum HRM2]